MSPTTYANELKKDLGDLIDLLPLTELQKRFLRSRWLDQLLWTESRADREKRRYYALRVIAILGGVIIPALVSLDIGDTGGSVVRWMTFALGLIVAAAVALEGFFRFGERWRHYRRTAELLKIEGWQFFELAGPYQAPDHSTTFAVFAARSEAVLQQDVEGFISVIATEKPLADPNAEAHPNGPVVEPSTRQAPSPSRPET
ncbi:MAG: DUF4231 domain-containing protein [Acidimicrobiales bacterium]